MFPTRFFAASYFAPRYFPRPGAVVPPVTAPTGGVYRAMYEPYKENDEDIFMMLLTEMLLNE